MFFFQRFCSIYFLQCKVFAYMRRQLTVTLLLIYQLSFLYDYRILLIWKLFLFSVFCIRAIINGLSCGFFSILLLRLKLSAVSVCIFLEADMLLNSTKDKQSEFILVTLPLFKQLQTTVRAFAIFSKDRQKTILQHVLSENIFKVLEVVHFWHQNYKVTAITIFTISILHWSSK